MRNDVTLAVVLLVSALAAGIAKHRFNRRESRIVPIEGDEQTNEGDYTPSRETGGPVHDLSGTPS